MAFNFADRLERGREILAGAGPSKLVIGGIILAAATAVLLVAMFYRGEKPYEVLYARLTPEDAGAITAELNTQKIPYRLAADGTAIEVESGRASAVRIDLAVKGLPAKGNVGFEIFDQQKLGVTDLVQKTNLMRAVTGELERSIMSLPEIEMARVHVAVPQDTMFIEDKKDPTASVVIKVARGAELSKPQLLGIVNLVVSSVTGLTPDNVSVIDTDGGLIWSKETNKPGLLNDDQMRQKALFEDAIKRRIQAMMERVVGLDKVITSVSAELDLKEVLTNEDIYDPDRTAIRSEQKIQERSLGPARAMAGIPNATYELGTANRQNSGNTGNQEQYSRTEETNNYEVTNIKRQTVSKAGDLKKISVSVLLDGVYTKNEAGDRVFSPLPADLLAQLEAAVKGVVGFDAKRGDLVSVSSVQFARPEEISAWALFALEVVREFYRPFINLILIVLFFFLVVRPIMNWLKKEVEPAGSGAEAPVLPEYPGGPGYGEGLPLPLPPQPLAEMGPAGPAGAELAAPAAAADETAALAPAYDDQEDSPNYDDEESSAEEEEEADEETKALAYGNLSRDNILPLARENLDRTVGLLRGWIEQKSSPQADKQ
ncbi:MAG: flagellar M-ring protein FliF [Candidatus Adiutrix sp.]|jgi:flagellar M-ring protein FliF|nr:flagellar M-ring protein FliF [Candidatus Adiutrix sp.]